MFLILSQGLLFTWWNKETTGGGMGNWRTVPKGGFLCNKHPYVKVSSRSLVPQHKRKEIKPKGAVSSSILMLQQSLARQGNPLFQEVLKKSLP
jgi:hypothetical protein